MNFAFCINNVYADKIAVVMTSLLENHPKELCYFYILSSDLTKENLTKLDKLHKKYKNFSIKKVDVPVQKFSSLKLNINYISKETYYRYLIADLLPDIDKILYLDADLIIRKNITSFYQKNIDNCYLMGVEDLWIKKLGYKPKINTVPDTPYVNAGVLLMNLKKMRQDRLSEFFLDKTKSLAGKIQYQDQDIINIVCAGMIGLVDSIYNFTSENMKQEKKKRSKACILHYTGQNKPWGKKKVRMKSVWQTYNRKTQSILNKENLYSWLTTFFKR